MLSTPTFRRLFLAALLASAALLSAPVASAQVQTPGGNPSGDPGNDPPGPPVGTPPSGGFGGPGDTVPPGGRAPGGPGSAPANPGAPGGPPATTGTPGRGGPGVPGAPADGPTSAPSPPTPFTFAGGVEPTSWRVWWEYNKDPYLQLKRAIHRGGATSGDDEFFLGQPALPRGGGSLAPTRADIEQHVLPQLLALLADGPGSELLRETLLALGRSGVGGRLAAADDLTRIASQYLGHSDQRVVEAAVVTLGLSGDFGAIVLLNQLVQGGEEGRRAMSSNGASAVPRRVRALAAYGLGLAAARSRMIDVRHYVVRNLALCLEGLDKGERELSVACISSLGITPLAIARESIEAARESRLHGGSSREGQVAWLLRYMRDDGRDNIARAHVPTALARLAVGLETEWKEVLIDELRLGLLRSSSGSRELRQSCALALGAIADADDDHADVRARSALESAFGDADLSTRYFAMIGLAQAAGRPGKGKGDPFAGTPRARRALLEQLARGKSGARPWAGLALGVLGRSLYDAGAHPHAEVSTALETMLADCRSPDEVGAYAIALGLRQDGQVRGLLEEKLVRFAGDDAACGEIAVALGLLGAGAADAALWESARNAQRRPYVLLQSSIGLALLGVKGIADELGSWLDAADSLALQVALADALGFVGDKRALELASAQLSEKSAVQYARASFARALGRIADRDMLPWAVPLSFGVNYRAETELLTPTYGGGLLDWD